MPETKPQNTKKFFEQAIKDVELTDERKELLTNIAETIASDRKKLHKVRLNFICTHNSRRSQLAQVWAHYAIAKYKLRKIKSFSGGTEVTAFHRNTIKTLQSVGFEFTLTEFSHTNPVYEITNSGFKKPIIGFSKVYNDDINKKPFIAITTCASADENCPFIPDAKHRFHLPYVDPKKSDGTDEMEKTYLKTNQQIAAEMNFLFITISNLI